MSRIVWTLALVMLLVVLATRPGRAQETKAAETTKSILDGVYSKAQAERGEGVFNQTCGACHGPAEFSSSSFLQSWDGARVYDLYRLISTTMPFDNPGGLAPQEYADVLAYVFELNEIPAGESELQSEAEALEQILIEQPPTGGAGSGSGQPPGSPEW